jgi:hypothetical protein
MGWIAVILGIDCGILHEMEDWLFNPVVTKIHRKANMKMRCHRKQIMKLGMEESPIQIEP